MIVNNDAREIEKVLELDKNSTSHLYNFIFKGTKAGKEVTIYTQPICGELEIIEIKGV